MFDFGLREKEQSYLLGETGDSKPCDKLKLIVCFPPKNILYAMTQVCFCSEGIDKYLEIRVRAYFVRGTWLRVPNRYEAWSCVVYVRLNLFLYCGGRSDKGPICVVDL